MDATIRITFLTFFAFVCVGLGTLTVSADVHASNGHKVLHVKQVKAGDRTFMVRVESKPSKKGTAGSGFCGTGEEVTLEIESVASKKVVFSKLIASCLLSMVLQTGEGNQDTMLNSLQLAKSPLEVRWQFVEGRSGVTGFIDLKADKIKYWEVPTVPVPAAETAN